MHRPLRQIPPIGPVRHGGRFAAVLFWAAVVLAPLRTARAGNDDEFFVGNRAAMTGGAVVAVVADGSALYYNPAGLGAVQRDSVDASASAYALRMLQAKNFLSSTTGTSDDANVTEFVPIPTKITYVRRLGARTSLGLGYFVPRASDILLRERLDVEPGGGASEPSTWSLDLRVTTAQYVLSAGIGSQITERLRLGVSLLGSYVATTESAGLFGTVGGDAAARSSAVHSAALATASRVGMELALGAQLELTRHLRLGVNLRSPLVRLYASSDASVNTAFGRLEPDAEPVLSANSQRIDEGSQLSVLRAGRYYVGAAWETDTGTLAAGADFQPGLSDVSTGVERRPTVNARAGYRHVLDEGVYLGVGVFSDRYAERLGDGLVTAQADFYGGTLGVQFDDLHRLGQEEAVDSLVFTTVFALRYAYGQGDGRFLRVDPTLAAGAPFDNATGTFAQHELGLHVGACLYF